MLLTGVCWDLLRSHVMSSAAVVQTMKVLCINQKSHSVRSLRFPSVSSITSSSFCWQGTYSRVWFSDVSFKVEAWKNSVVICKCKCSVLRIIQHFGPTWGLRRTHYIVLPTCGSTKRPCGRGINISSWRVAERQLIIVSLVTEMYESTVYIITASPIKCTIPIPQSTNSLARYELLNYYHQLDVFMSVCMRVRVTKLTSPWSWVHYWIWQKSINPLS